MQIGSVWCFLYGRAGRLTAKNGGLRPVQAHALAERARAAGLADGDALEYWRALHVVVGGGVILQAPLSIF